jgi:hypothetical protein
VILMQFRSMEAERFRVDDGKKTLR